MNKRNIEILPLGQMSECLILTLMTTHSAIKFCDQFSVQYGIHLVIYQTNEDIRD
jgi:hypothetical protein